jgi:hypothetical protein
VYPLNEVRGVHMGEFDYIVKKSLITPRKKISFKKKIENFGKIVDATNKLVNYILVTKRH